MKNMIPTLFLLVAFAAPLAAQADPDTNSAASKSYFMLNVESGHGGRTTSTTYVLNASCGSGAVAQPSASAKFRLIAGYLGSAETSATGQPWLAGVTPRFVTLRGPSRVSLHGTELNLGGAPAVTIGGKAAALLGASRDRADVRLPIQPAPGWQPVRLSTPRGVTELPRGIGVLPMIYTDPAPASRKRMEVVFKGSPGDQVIWALSIGALPTALPLSGIWHGLLLDPRVIVVLPGLTIPNANANGELRLSIPPTPIVASVYVQAVFSTRNPGYGPATFSNLLVVTP